MLTFCWGLLHLCFSGMSLLFYVQLFWGPMDCSPPASSVHGISQEKYWSGLPFPSPWDLPNPGIWTCVSCIADRFFTTEPLRKPFYKEYWPLIFFVCVCVYVWYLCQVLVLGQWWPLKCAWVCSLHFIFSETLRMIVLNLIWMFSNTHK